MARDIQIFVKTYDTCIRIKSRPAVKYGLRNLEPGELHTKIEIDHHDMTRISSSGHAYKYILVITDLYSQDCLFLPTYTQSAAETADLIYNPYIVKKGWPKYVITDRHKSFMSQLMSSMAKLSTNGCKIIHSSQFLPRSSGLVEGKNKHIITFMRAVDQTKWPQYLPTLELSVRSSINTALGVNPYFAEFGRHMSLAIDTTLLDRASTEFDSQHAAN